MVRFGKLRFSARMDRLRAGMSRIEVLALYPGLVLVAVWLGHLDILLVTAFLLPGLLALQAFVKMAQPRPDDMDKGDEDALAQLPTRPALTAMADRVAGLAPAKSTVAIFLHIDALDSVTELWGSEAVDTILNKSADRLRGTLRNDDLIARIGDAGFGIVLRPMSSTNLDVILGLIDRIQAAFGEPVAVAGTTVHVTASFGYCTLDMAPARTGRSVLEAADTALTEARRHGPSAIRAFSKKFNMKRRKRVDLVDKVETALAGGEIKAWYQPQVSTDTGVISGFEALARWHHPDEGVLPPVEFLGAIADAGHMAKLGEVMLYNALSALKSWDQAGLKIPSVAVNFSAEELRDPQLADRIKWDVDRFDLRASRLTIEILETVAAQSEDDIIIRNIEMLGSHGFNLDLDDFGTGQASIANIRRFHVNRIKIDRSFITRLDKDAKQQSMVSAILSLADHLGVDTLAEGVETTGEHSMLAQLGCGHVQGFGLARPMPFEDTIAWARAHTDKLASPARIGRQAG
ncbi:phosphodiesterase [Rhodophyticola sp. CCM32]|uniref:putative bifunctional diguanylate cyclase/phosphodiesterase n=1 Tax=Rhodophyticola sp. CCM32 TaxID=2916397 RepID=UPI00107F61F1|nr:GGDEF domain-containing phosphodiesterase [Rhodophyticola sp. CCM32]QBY02391.1 phosphodiesterase [Rhodophyticola sp. CCM32]